MVRQAALIDAYPGMADAVFASLEKYPRVVRKQLLRDGNVDIVALVEADDPDVLSDYVAGTIRFVDGVFAVRLVRGGEELSPPVRRVLTDWKVG